MFRQTEDEYLRKGDYSRNCLSFEEEVELAKNANKVSAAITDSTFELAPKVLISAGGKCTESFVKALFYDDIVWDTNSLGTFGLVNGKLAAFLCPASKRLNQADQVILERTIADWVFQNPHADISSIVVFCSIPVGGNDLCRTLAYPQEVSESSALLPKGQLLTSFPAALFERCLRKETPNVSLLCVAVPREPVLSMETLESLIHMARVTCTPAQVKRAKNRFHLWAKEAILQDEKEMRKSEPEGMFM